MNQNYGMPSQNKLQINNKEVDLHENHQKKKIQDRKASIQKKYQDKVGLLIDFPRSCGSGSSNHGNTARWFFQNAEKTAEILKLDVSIIKILHVILCTLSSGYVIDSSRFRDFCTQIAERYVNQYPWYHMPQSLHRILVHW